MFEKSMIIVVALAGTALAQDGQDPLGKAMQGAPPSGLRSGDLRVPEPPSGLTVVGEGRAPAGVAPAPVATGGPAGPTPEAADPSVEISANYDVTEATYLKILETQGVDTGQIDRRIAQNEEIVARFRPQLTTTEEELRKLQVEFMGKAFALRQKKDAGALSDDQFQKAIAAEEGKWNRRKNAVGGDATYFREEVQQAEVRLVQLRTAKKEMDERLAREGKLKPKKKAPGDAVMEGFQGTLEKLSGFKTRFTMDGNAGCKHCNDFHATTEHPAETERETVPEKGAVADPNLK